MQTPSPQFASDKSSTQKSTLKSVQTEKEPKLKSQPLNAPTKQLTEKKLNNYLQQAQFIINKKSEAKGTSSLNNDHSKVKSHNDKDNDNSNSSIILFNSAKQ